jgi:hypothetical protein
VGWVPTYPPVVAVLRGLLGRDFVFLPESAVHDSGYGGWHKDTGAQERAGLTFHWEPDFRMVQVALYLQDNTPAAGGGLDVIPGSHLRRDQCGEFRERGGLRDWLQARLWGAVRGCAYSVPSAAGDLVLFHYRLDHRATQPAAQPVPPEHRKLAIFFACSANNRHVRKYIDFIACRPEYHYLKDHRYPDNLLRAAREQHLTLL